MHCHVASSLLSGELELELELIIQTRMIQKPLLWVEMGKSACVLVGICELRLSPPARYDPQALWRDMHVRNISSEVKP